MYPSKYLKMIYKANSLKEIHDAIKEMRSDDRLPAGVLFTLEEYAILKEGGFDSLPPF